MKTFFIHLTPNTSANSSVSVSQSYTQPVDIRIFSACFKKLSIQKKKIILLRVQCHSFFFFRSKLSKAFTEYEKNIFRRCRTYIRFMHILKKCGPKSDEEKYKFILDCLKLCTSKEVELLEFLLRKDLSAHHHLSQLKDISPLLVAILSIIAAIFTSQSVSINLSMQSLIVLFVYAVVPIFIYLLCQSFGDGGVKRTSFILSIIERKYNCKS